MEKFQSINSGWLASISLMSGIVGQVYLYLIKNVPVGLFFFIVAAVCLIIGLKKSGKETEDSKNIFSVSFNPSLKTEIILLFFVLIIAAFMRLFMIDSIPSGCFSDEALNGLTALDILNGRSLPVYIGPQAPNNAAVFMYYIAVIFKLFGIGATQLRLTPAFLGILAVPAFYFLIRYIGGAGPALTGSFILALMRWHIIFSRIAFHAAFAVVAVIFVLYFALRSFYSKKTYDFIFLGITFSFSFYTYQSARLCFFVLIIFMIYVFFYERNFYRKNLRKIALAVAVAVVVFVPMGIYIANHFNAFFSRQAEVSIVNKNNYNFKDSIQEQTWRSQKTWYNMLFYNIQAGMLMFNYKGDANERHNLPGQPELDFFTGIFALIGFLYALTRLSNPVYFFFTTSFIIFMCAGFFTIESPQSLRTVAAIPCVAFFALVFIFNFLSCFKSAKSVSIAFVVIFIMLLLSAYNNFLDFGKLCQDG
jgi:4-amino-4-deoxy-L-arabinose transferase-like glycosyltransferase